MASHPEIVYKLTCYAPVEWDKIDKKVQKNLGLYGQLPCEGKLFMAEYCWNCQLCGREVKGYK